METNVTITVSVPPAKAIEIISGLKGESAVAKKGRPAKIEEPEANEDETFAADDTDADEDTTAKKYTLKDVNNAIKSYAAENGREAANKIMKKFKIGNTEALPAKRYSEFIEAVKEA